MADSAPPWAGLMNMISPQRPTAPSLNPQTEHVTTAHKVSVQTLPPLMDMSTTPSAQGGTASSLEPDTIQPPGGS